MSKILLIFILLCIVSFSIFSETNGIDEIEISLLLEKIKKIENYGIGASFIIFFLQILGYVDIRKRTEKWIKKKITSQINSSLNGLENKKKIMLQDIEKFKKNIENEMKNNYENLISIHVEQYKDEILKLSQIVSLSVHKQYDRALKLAGWNDNLDSIKKYPDSIKQILIECLLHTKSIFQNKPSIVWESVQLLLQENTNICNFIFLLNVAIQLKKYEDAKAHFEIYENQLKLRESRNCLELYFIILRNLGVVKEALEIIRKYPEPNDLFVLNNYAAFMRDIGKFDYVHDQLINIVRDKITNHIDHLSRDLRYVFNTFIANCIDRKRPEDGLDAAWFLIHNNPRPEQSLTCLRLSIIMNNEIGEKIKVIIKGMVSDHDISASTIKLRATYAELDGNIDTANKIIDEGIIKIRNDNIDPKQDIYFLECYKADILMRNGKYSKAKAVLIPQVNLLYGGEARYKLAKTYALLNQNEDAVNWIKQASQERVRWAVIARDDRDLGKIAQVREVIKIILKEVEDLNSSL